ncbi:MAG: monovalent cation/H(+) antiporter subunit G [Alcanivorax sp.]|nr:monovalent cation/H(+) antiporter subunit G [Alcanivorax sp.]
MTTDYVTFGLELATAVFMLVGALFMLLAGLGALRMPDLLMRMHATTKAGALGSGVIMVAVAIHFGEAGVTTRAVAITLFIMLTSPVAAHVIARAGYFTGTPMWSRIVRDELKGKYDRDNHTLDTPPRYKLKATADESTAPAPDAPSESQPEKQKPDDSTP